MNARFGFIEDVFATSSSLVCISLLTKPSLAREEPLI
jgi:hypothetical protein